ncbi:hypothetical protein [Nocardia vinacea]|uniref:hypothetical protein n=1 Tax=Nocardia vinacea TaxID=96468 RepID=UPI0012F6FE32|nr:hypothetical protein [Nocardia vinacea]
MKRPLHPRRNETISGAHEAEPGQQLEQHQQTHVTATNHRFERVPLKLGKASSLADNAIEIGTAPVRLTPDL